MYSVSLQAKNNFSFSSLSRGHYTKWEEFKNSQKNEGFNIEWHSECIKKDDKVLILLTSPADGTNLVTSID